MDRIILDNVGKSYYRTWLFKNISISFDCSKQHSYAILGNNGSGKSTLLLMLCQQTSPTEGRLTWNEDDHVMDRSDVHKKYALTSPLLELPEEMNLKEWYQFHTKIKRFIKDVTLEYIIDLCGFNKKTIEKPLNHYSSGMKQRVKLCLNLLSDTTVSFLDEPTSNLDAQGIQLYHSLVENRMPHKCIFIASNDPQEYAMVKTKFIIENKNINPL
jgi:ABC-type multidrug transport system ATPase subunit